MNYLCLVYYNEQQMEQMSQDEWDTLNEECRAYSELLHERGQRLAGEALEPTHTATTVRVRDGKIITTDGPFAEAREQLAGFYSIEARDLNEAISVASRIAPARFGSIEIRPVRPLIAPETP
jgi:hypothetical protein